MSSGSSKPELPLLSRAQVRSVDRRAIDEYGMSGLVLMENAGRGCADVLQRLGIAGTVVICCGKGNNGGDGFVVARHLDLRGFAVRAVYWDDPAEFSPDCRANFDIAIRGGVPVQQLAVDDRASWQQCFAGADWLVDALLGTGARGDPRPPYAAVIDCLNAQSARRLAVDWPSGLDCDSGAASSATFRADHTCTFVAAKLGAANPAAQQYLGQLHVIDIGAPRRLVEEILRTSAT